MWDWAIWTALIAGGLAIAGALAYLGVRALQAWRDFKRVRRHLFKAADELTARGEALADDAADALDTTEVTTGLERLRGSLAQLAVLREAVDEAQDALGRIVSVMPRK